MKKIMTLVMIMMLLLSAISFSEVRPGSEQIFDYELETLRGLGPVSDGDHTLVIGHYDVTITDKNGKTVESFKSVKDKVLAYDSYLMENAKGQKLHLKAIKSNAKAVEEIDAQGYVDNYLETDIELQLDFGADKKYSFKTHTKILRRFSTSVPLPYQGIWVSGQHKLEIDDFVLRYTDTERNTVRTFQMAQTETGEIPYRSREYSDKTYTFQGSEQVDGQLVRNFGEKDYDGTNALYLDFSDPNNYGVMNVFTDMSNMPTEIFDLRRTNSREDLPYIGVRPALFEADKVWDVAVFGDMIPYLPLPVGNQVNLVWDNGTFNFSKPAQILQDATMVPAKDYFENFGFSASDDGNNFSMFNMGVEIYAEKGSNEVKIIDNADIDGRYTVILSAPVQEVDGTLFVPLRFAANLTDLTLVWYDKNKTASLVGIGASYPNLERFDDYRD